MDDLSNRVYRLLSRYQDLLSHVDARAEEVREAYPGQIACRRGCTDCCHQPFDISWLEGFYLWIGLNELDPETRARVLDRAEAYEKWAGTQSWGSPETIQGTPEERTARMRLRIDAMSASHTACPLLEDGACLLYDYRPAVCRLAGYPLPDPVDDSALYACFKNFTGQDLTKARVESFDVDRVYTVEANLERELLKLITGKEWSVRYTTQIAGALQTDYEQIDWQAFFEAIEKGET